MPSTYAIASVSGRAGSLHVHHGRDAQPRETHTDATLYGPHCGTLSSTTLYSLSRPSGTSSASALPHLASHTLCTSSRSSYKRSGAPEALTCICSSYSGRLLLAGSTSGHIYIWLLPSGELVRSSTSIAASAAVTALKVLHGDTAVAVAYADASVHVLDVSSLLMGGSGHNNKGNNEGRSLVGHVLPVCAMDAGPGGVVAKLVTVSTDRSARVWHPASRACLHTFNLPCAPSGTMCASADDAVFALSSGDIVRISLTALPSGGVSTISAQHTFAGRRSDGAVVSALTMSPEGDEVVTGYSDGVVRVYDFVSCSLVHSYSKHAPASPITFVGTLQMENDKKSVIEEQGMIPKGLAKQSMDMKLGLEPKQKQREKEFLDEIEVHVDMTKCTPCHVVANEFVGHAVCRVFQGDWLCTQGQGQAKRKRIGRGGDARVAALLQEVVTLKQRNRQLEEAGVQLAQLVQRSLENKS